MTPVVPWEEVNAAATAAAQSKPESPPPTFATATATAALLTDRREVVNDTSQGTFCDPLFGLLASLLTRYDWSSLCRHLERRL